MAKGQLSPLTLKNIETYDSINMVDHVVLPLKSNWRVTGGSVGRGGMTAYGRLAEELWSRIASGEWSPGTKLPTVVELARIYGVSPVTVRGALSLLVEQGLVHSRQGKGTFVLESAVGATSGDELGEAYFESWIVGPEESVQVLARTESVTLPTGLADGFVAESDYVYLRRLHLANARPVCLVDFFMATDSYESLPSGVDDRFKIGLLLMTKAVPRPVRGRQIVTVVTATSEDSELLKIPAGSPVVRVDRHFSGEDGILLGAGIHRYPGAVFKQVIDQPVDDILSDIKTWLPTRNNDGR